MTVCGGGLRTIILLGGCLGRAFGRGIRLGIGSSRGGGAAKSIHDAGVGGLFLQVPVPDAGGAFVAAGPRDPGVLG